MKRSYSKILIFVISIFLILLMSSIFISAKTTINLGFGSNEEHPSWVALNKFKEIVEEGSKGELEVKLFPNSILGSDREMMEQIISGALGMNLVTTAVLSSYVPEFLALDFPFLWPDSKVQDKVLDGKFGTWLKNLSYERNLGFKFLNYWEAGFRSLTTNRRPILTPDDLKGLKIRLMENPIHLATFRALGAITETIPFGELYSALQQGVVDGQENPLVHIYSMHFYEVQKYLTITRHLNTPLCLLISSNTWNKLTTEQQELIIKAADIARDIDRRDCRATEEELTKKLVDEGMVLNILTPEQLKLFQEKVQPVYDELAPKVGEEVFSNLMREIKQAKESE